MKKVCTFAIVCSLAVWFTAAAIKPLNDAVANSLAEREAATDYSTPLIRCFCNLPACLESSGGVQTCTSSLGCFSELEPAGPDPSGVASDPDVPPIPMAMDEDAAEIAAVDKGKFRGQYGCLELSSTYHAHKNKVCNTTLKSVEEEDLTMLSSASFENSDHSEIVNRYYCCVTNTCNKITHIAAAAAAVLEANSGSVSSDSSSSAAPQTADAPVTRGPLEVFDYVIGSAQNETENLPTRGLDSGESLTAVDTRDPQTAESLVNRDILSAIDYMLGLAQNETKNLSTRSLESGESLTVVDTRDPQTAESPVNRDFLSAIDYVLGLAQNETKNLSTRNLGSGESLTAVDTKDPQTAESPVNRDLLSVIDYVLGLAQNETKNLPTRNLKSGKSFTVVNTRDMQTADSPANRNLLSVIDYVLGLAQKKTKNLPTRSLENGESLTAVDTSDSGPNTTSSLIGYVLGITRHNVEKTKKQSNGTLETAKSFASAGFLTSQQLRYIDEVVNLAERNAKKKTNNSSNRILKNTAAAGSQSDDDDQK